MRACTHAFARTRACTDACPQVLDAAYLVSAIGEQKHLKLPDWKLLAETKAAVIDI